MNTSIEPAPSRGKWLRILLAGPYTFVCAFITMVGSSAYIPVGAAKLNNIAIPLVLFPAIWAILFFYSSLTARPGRAFFVLTGLLVIHAALLVTQLNGLNTP